MPFNWNVFSTIQNRRKDIIFFQEGTIARLVGKKQEKGNEPFFFVFYVERKQRFAGSVRMWAFQNGASGIENGIILNLLKNSSAVRKLLFNIFITNKGKKNWKTRIPKEFVQEFIHP